MKNTLISVIVAIYNVEQYLEKCILSIMNQTYSELQIILVNDGSTDTCAEICDRFQKVDQRIQVIHKKNGGLVNARKEGIRHAEGAYLSYIDGDDWIEADMLERLYSAACESGAEVVCSGHYIDREGSRKAEYNLLAPGTYCLDEIRHKILYNDSFYEFGITPYMCSKLFRTDILAKQQLLVDEMIAIGEDLAAGIPTMLSASKIHITSYAGYHYVQRQSSITHKKDMREFERVVALLAHLKKILEKETDRNVLMGHLGQYAKFLFLQRQLWWFDKDSDKLLTPFGGIEYGSKVIIYGAGAFGKEMYQYLMEDHKAEVTGWYDREFEICQREGYPVRDPQTLVNSLEESDYIIIAALKESISESIQKDIYQMRVKDSRIRWLTEGFLEDSISLLTECLA